MPSDNDAEDGGEKNQYYYPVGELIDMMTINQIKEIKLSGERCEAAARNLHLMSSDLDNYSEKCNISTMRYDLFFACVVLLALVNIMVWHHKDIMADCVNDEEKYDDILKLCQELNDLRNHIRNMFLTDFKQTDLLGIRAVFSDLKDKNLWIYQIVQRLDKMKR